jgi:aquaporin Z
MRILRAHWPEYVLEAAGMAIILLVSAAITVFATTALPQGWPSLPRRMVEGLFIAGTVVTLIYSPWGLRSGAHYNPTVTLTFLMLGRVTWVDAVFYVLFQFVGAVIGIGLAGLVLGPLLREPPVRWIVTQPGVYGTAVAFAAEAVISFLVMEVILVSGGLPGLHRYTGVLVGIMIFTFICIESPISGFSMNPARTFGSAIASGHWMAFWVYVFAPPMGMLTAAMLNRTMTALPSANCAKLVHSPLYPCIHCGMQPQHEASCLKQVRCHHREVAL